MALKKVGPRDLQVLIDFTKPDPRTVAFRGRKAEIFYPKLKHSTGVRLGQADGSRGSVSARWLRDDRKRAEVELRCQVLG